MNSQIHFPAISARSFAIMAASATVPSASPGDSPFLPSSPQVIPCYTLHHDGADWSLRQFSGQRILARYQCRRTALSDSMARAHTSGAKLILLPGTPKALSFMTSGLI